MSAPTHGSTRMDGPDGTPDGVTGDIPWNGTWLGPDDGQQHDELHRLHRRGQRQLLQAAGEVFSKAATAASLFWWWRGRAESLR